MVMFPEYFFKPLCMDEITLTQLRGRLGHNNSNYIARHWVILRRARCTTVDATATHTHGREYVRV